jgi:hypothetical protein
MMTTTMMMMMKTMTWLPALASGVVEPAPEWAGAAGIRGRDIRVPVRRTGAGRGGT